jgi:hypothetical protein
MPQNGLYCVQPVYGVDVNAFHESNGKLGRAIDQAVSRWFPTAAARVQTRGLLMCDLWWTKWGRFSPSTSGSPANLYSAISPQ